MTCGRWVVRTAKKKHLVIHILHVSVQKETCILNIDSFAVNQLRSLLIVLGVFLTFHNSFHHPTRTRIKPAHQKTLRAEKDQRDSSVLPSSPPPNRRTLPELAAVGAPNPALDGDLTDNDDDDDRCTALTFRVPSLALSAGGCALASRFSGRADDRDAATGTDAAAVVAENTIPCVLPVTSLSIGAPRDFLADAFADEVTLLERRTRPAPPPPPPPSTPPLLSAHSLLSVVAARAAHWFSPALALLARLVLPPRPLSPLRLMVPLRRVMPLRLILPSRPNIPLWLTPPRLSELTTFPVGRRCCCCCCCCCCCRCRCRNHR